MFAANQNPACNRKDTVRNVESTGEFCWNVANWDLREAVNITGEWLKDEVDEFERAGLEKQKADLVNVPMVKASPIKFECKYYSTLRLPGNPPTGTVDVIIGKVIGIHIDESVLTDGKIDLGKVQPIARCGYGQYAVIRPDVIFEMVIPGDPNILVGLEGSTKNAEADKPNANS
jgi:flavin reductase (DIM6/NTAB) family NADH-FMN oxidoreductase RutF